MYNWLRIFVHNECMHHPLCVSFQRKLISTAFSPTSTMRTSWHDTSRQSGQSVKFAKSLMSGTFSEERDLSYGSSVRCPEYARKDWRGDSCRLHPRQCGQKVHQGPGGVVTRTVTRKSTIGGIYVCARGRSVTSLGYQGWRRVSWKGPNFLTMSNSFHLCSKCFSRGSENFSKNFRPPTPFLVTGLAGGIDILKFYKNYTD